MLSEIKTKENLDTFVENLNRLKLDLYRINVANPKILNNWINDNYDYVFSTLIREALPNVFKSTNTNSLSAELLENEIENIKSGLKNVIFVQVTLAFVPSQSFINKICSFVQSAYGENVILDLKTDPNLLGGVVVSHGGRYLDYSLKKKLKELDLSKYISYGEL